MGVVKLEAAFLANHAEVHDGLLFVTGGFPEWWSTPALNALQQMALVVVTRLERSEILEKFTYEIVIERPDESQQPVVYVATSRGALPGTSDDQPFFQTVPINFSIDFRQLGLHRYLVKCAGSTLADVPFEVRLAPQRGASDVAKADDSAAANVDHGEDR
jgi:hypothetical protein